MASHQLENGYAMMLVILIEGYVAVGGVAMARPLAQEALAVAQERIEHGFETYALHQLGVIAAQGEVPDVTAATHYYQYAIALAQELGMRPLLAHLHCRMGTLHSHLGQHAQATVALSTAVDVYRALAMTFWLPQAELALARVSQGQVG